MIFLRIWGGKKKSERRQPLRPLLRRENTLLILAFPPGEKGHVHKNLPPPACRWQANLVRRGATRPENRVRRFPVEKREIETGNTLSHGIHMTSRQPPFGACGTTFPPLRGGTMGAGYYGQLVIMTVEGKNHTTGPQPGWSVFPRAAGAVFRFNPKSALFIVKALTAIAAVRRHIKITPAMRALPSPLNPGALRPLRLPVSFLLFSRRTVSRAGRFLS